MLLLRSPNQISRDAITIELVFLCVHIGLCTHPHIIFVMLLNLEAVWVLPVVPLEKTRDKACLWQVASPLLPVGVPADTQHPLVATVRTHRRNWVIRLSTPLSRRLWRSKSLPSTKAGHDTDEMPDNEFDILLVVPLYNHPP